MQLLRNTLQRYESILNYIGAALILVSVSYLLPLVVLLFYPAEGNHATGFLMAAGVAFGTGILLYFSTPRYPFDINLPESMLLIVIVWLLVIGFGTIPLLYSTDLNFTQAIFESTSGWTTTGLTVVEVEQMPRIILFYRSLMQLIGGLGFVILSMAAVALPIDRDLPEAAGYSDMLLPNMRRSAVMIVGLYTTYTVIGLIALRIAGMDWFAAVNHAFSTVSSGGFATRSGSIGAWDSIEIEAVIIVLMALSMVNFPTALLIIRRQFRPALNSGEIRVSSLLLPIGAVLLFIGATRLVYDGIAEETRIAVFEGVSALSTTGFTITEYTGWPGAGILVLIVMMVIGGGDTSTNGGLKQNRLYILYRTIRWEIRHTLTGKDEPQERQIWHGSMKIPVEDKVLRQTAAFVTFYIVILLTGVFVVALHGYTLQESLFEFASTLGTVGLSVGITAADAPDTLLLTQSFGMLLGRLELFTLLIGVARPAVDTVELIEEAGTSA
jgi:trk system potassium uptake protein